MLSYAIDGSLEGNGVMLAAVTQVVEMAFGPLRIPSLGARYHRDNDKSARLLACLGFCTDEALLSHPWLLETPDSLLAIRRWSSGMLPQSPPPSTM